MRWSRLRKAQATGIIPLSNNGRYIAFASDQSGGPQNIWIRDLVTRKESSLASSSFVQWLPLINAVGQSF